MTTNHLRSTVDNVTSQLSARRDTQGEDTIILYFSSVFFFSDFKFIKREVRVPGYCSLFLSARSSRRFTCIALGRGPFPTWVCLRLAYLARFAVYLRFVAEGFGTVPTVTETVDLGWPDCIIDHHGFR